MILCKALITAITVLGPIVIDQVAYYRRSDRVPVRASIPLHPVTEETLDYLIKAALSAKNIHLKKYEVEVLMQPMTDLTDEQWNTYLVPVLQRLGASYPYPVYHYEDSGIARPYASKKQPG